MEQILENAILGNFNDEQIEYLVVDNVLIDRDEIEREENNFSLSNFRDEEVRLNFRFELLDIPHIVHALRIPDQVITETGNKVSGQFWVPINIKMKKLCILGLKALCILLKRLAYASMLSDLCSFFNLTPQ